ncbi:UNVERIFIED_CONTAM: hypothetical protein GTU68_027292, partial [Idotea baltica]|nr:hypothetical protein [Idotea baltica]
VPKPPKGCKEGGKGPEVYTKGDSKKKRKRRKESSASTSTRWLKQVHPDTGVLLKAMSIMNSFVNYISRESPPRNKESCLLSTSVLITSRESRLLSRPSLSRWNRQARRL